jgi:hypothetical protein
MKITEIPEKQLPVGLRKKRTAIYARVSSNKEEQENSFEAQKSYFEKFIRDSENLVYAGTYADYGISGTEHTIVRQIKRCFIQHFIWSRFADGGLNHGRLYDAISANCL